MPKGTDWTVYTRMVVVCKLLHFADYPKPDYYYNYDLKNVITPVDVDRLVHLLRESDYDETETLFLENGFCNGFDIGYEGPQQRMSESDNIPLTVGNKTELWNKIMKEVKLK